MEVSRFFLPYTMCCESDVHCGVWHWWGNTVLPRQKVNAVYYCTFLQYHIRSALRRKRRHLVVQNSNILHDKAKDSHRCCSHGPLATLAMGDSGTSTVLTRYECMLLRSQMKEPLGGTRYKTRDELIRAIGQSIRNINKYLEKGDK